MNTMETVKIILWRHGKAEKNSETGRDEDRRLVALGREQTARVAQALKKREPDLSRICSSPYRRALETAEVVREVFDFASPVQILPELASGAFTENLFQAVRTFPTKDVAICVGHMPDLSLLTELLIGHPNGFSFSTGALAAFEISPSKNPSRAKLLYRLSPEDLNV